MTQYGYSGAHGHTVSFHLNLCPKERFVPLNKFLSFFSKLAKVCEIIEKNNHEMDINFIEQARNDTSLGTIFLVNFTGTKLTNWFELPI